MSTPEPEAPEDEGPTKYDLPDDLRHRVGERIRRDQLLHAGVKQKSIDLIPFDEVDPTIRAYWLRMADSALVVVDEWDADVDRNAGAL